MNAPENPQAFPFGIVSPMGDSYTQEGMTLRDWFAGQVGATALFHAISEMGNPEALILRDSLPEEWSARIAYAFADAMLAERSKA